MSVPVLVATIAFGLSVDYEVFLLSRIRERWLVTGDNVALVRLLLVPATMTLAGRYNWWAPTPLRRLHTRLGAVRRGRGPRRTPVWRR